MSQRPAQKSNSKYLTVGQILEGKPRDGEEKGDLYIKFDSKLKVVINGIDFTDKFVYINKATEKFDRMLDNGALTQEEYDAKIEAHSKNGKQSFVKYDLSAKI